MSGVIAAGLKAQDVSFTDCRIDDGNFRMAAWEHCQWLDSDLRASDFYAGTLTDCAFRRCDLTGVEFSKTQCHGLSLHGSALDGVRGAGSLGGSVISSEQIVPLALGLFTALNIRVDDEAPESEG